MQAVHRDLARLAFSARREPDRDAVVKEATCAVHRYISEANTARMHTE